MISADILQAAVKAVTADGRAKRVVLFGSYARGDATDESDLDLLVIEDEVTNRAEEMVRLRRLLRPLRVPADVLVYSAEEITRWGDQPGSALYRALREGKVVYG